MVLNLLYRDSKSPLIHLLIWKTGLIILMIIWPVFLYKGIVKNTVILYLCDYNYN